MCWGPFCACSKPLPPVEVGFVWWFVQACAAVNNGVSGLVARPAGANPVPSPPPTALRSLPPPPI